MSEDSKTLAICKPAPHFTAPAYLPATDDVNGTVSLDDYQGKWLLLFFYPLDFTFVCPTELIELGKLADKFKEINCEVLVGSIDSTFSHQAWIKQDARLKNISFPFLSDISKKVGTAYNIVCDDGMHLRGAFIIDPEGILRSMTINDLPVGRNPEELLRTIKAFQTGDLCPVNWHKGEETLGKA